MDLLGFGLVLKLNYLLKAIEQHLANPVLPK